MKLVPIADRVILKGVEAEETTKSGIVLPGQAKEKPMQGEIVAVGPGGMIDGKEVEMVVKKGQMVVFSQYAGHNITIDEEEYVIIKQSDIMAIIEK